MPGEQHALHQVRLHHFPGKKLVVHQPQGDVGQHVHLEQIGGATIHPSPTADRLGHLVVADRGAQQLGLVVGMAS